MGADRIQVEIKEEGTFSLKKGESVLSVLLEEKLVHFTNCGGNGTCGKCIVRFTKGAPLPLPADRRAFPPDRLREGYRLACKAKPMQNCVLELCLPEAEDFILTGSSMMPAQRPSVQSMQPDSYGAVMLIADLGTTTIVLQLVSVADGQVIDTYRQMNPQRQFGADVVSRMQHSMAGKRVLLAELVWDCIQTGIDRWLQAGFAPSLCVMAGNTVMIHLLMQYDVTGLAAAPFTPVTTSRIEISCGGIKTVLMPGISAFVGGDIVAGILACRQQMSREHKSLSLLLDLGTNGEMALIGKNQIVCTATAAGPAFEGGAGAGIPGSDMISITAELLTRGVLDETGLLREDYFACGVTAAGVTIRQEDVRGLQMAKAAVSAGIQILLRACQMDAGQLERVYLAGGFGYKLDVESACKTGVLPRSLKDRTIAVGNSVLAGAYLYGKEYLARPCSEPAEEVLKLAQAMNLAQQEEFHDLYMQNINLCEKE